MCAFFSKSNSSDNVRDEIFCSSTFTLVARSTATGRTDHCAASAVQWVTDAMDAFKNTQTFIGDAREGAVLGEREMIYMQPHWPPLCSVFRLFFSRVGACNIILQLFSSSVAAFRIRTQRNCNCARGQTRMSLDFYFYKVERLHCGAFSITSFASGIYSPWRAAISLQTDRRLLVHAANQQRAIKR